MVAELMSYFFTRKEMCSHSLTGQKANTTHESKPALPNEKVQAIINYVGKRFPGVNEAQLRLCMRTKLSNERKMHIKTSKPKVDDTDVSIMSVLHNL
jgi:hypothetical protein